MKITEELRQYYLPYFQTMKDLEKALFFEDSALNQKKAFAFIKSAAEKSLISSIRYTKEATGVISTNKYEVHFAVLPSGDLVYYTVNKNTKKKGNYHRVMQLESIYNHLTKLGVINESTGFFDILNDMVFGEAVLKSSFMQKASNVDSITNEDGWSSISITSSMTVDLEFPILNGSSQIVLNMEDKEIRVGYIHFRIYNSYQLSRFELLDAADALSGDEEWLMSAFLDAFEEEIEEWSPKCLTLDRILVEPVYRNKGYGKLAIKELVKLCEILGVDYIVLKPSPVEEADFSDKAKAQRKEDIKRLVSFYDQLGFDIYSLNEEEPFMVLNVNEQCE
ncbi:GNAT family N-acetyltransferase [Lysinibacillus louembei]|uniref:GNAT family N-acetyltransferase n=1 Tax=Lysinibacillus louembei TaxID=1470088 RepID=A0ABZ0RT93_9BACI|nr:GNAT family N-acetyltransferase [Lysinibacillus louembei]WPK10294.1 GNAT family N-acetyltransferase [Lysinibacillus louembei]